LARKWIIVGVLGAAALAAAGWLAWISQRPAGGAAPVRPVRVAIEGQVVTFDPHAHDESKTWAVLFNLYEGLVRFDHHLRLQPCLAESWSNPDPLRWVFKIRRGVTFHDGRTLGADDVVYSLRRAIFHEDSMVSSYFASVRSVAASGPDSVVVETAEPDPILLNKLTFAYIVPAADSLAQPSLGTRPVGTGPFRLDGWRADDRFALRRFDGYWGRPPVVNEVEVVGIADEVSRVAALADGEVDLARGLDWSHAGRLSERRSLSVRAENSLTVMMLSLYTGEWLPDARWPKRNPLATREVRQALRLALDRPAIAARIQGGRAQPSSQYGPPEVFGFDDELAAPSRDVAAARRLLQAAGYPDGFVMELHVYSTIQSLGEGIRNSLAETGIRVRFRYLSWDETYQRMFSANPPQAVIFGWGCTSGDLSDFFESCLHTRNSPGWEKLGAFNTSRFSNARFDELIRASRTQMDPSQRLAMLASIQRQALEEAPVIPLTINPHIYGFNAELAWEPRRDIRLDFSSFRWLSPAVR
jgi:peptide/nickel transport system substrate-binding protein